MWSNNLQQAHLLARELEAGTIAVNHDTQIWHYAAPYGGFKQSGIGREFGEWSMRAFTEVKHVWLNLNTRPVAWP